MATTHPAPRLQAPAHPPRYAGALRVTGTLTAPAELRPTTDAPPHLLLCVRLQPERGLPYVAWVDLGNQVANHMAAEALLPHLRPGAVLSVAAEALELLEPRSEHDTPALRLVRAHSAVLFPPTSATAIPEPAEPAEPDLFSTPQPA